MGRCSTPEELEQFLSERLDALETEVIAAHLEDCAACREVLEQITSCAIRPAVPMRSGPIESEDWVDAVLERVKAKGPRPPVVSAEDRQNRDHEIACSLIEGPSHKTNRVEGRERSFARPFPELEGFRIIREIGRGGMGVVYEAEEENLSRRVAVKILQAHSLEDPRQILRFEREAKAAGRLHHTNIVPVFGVGESLGTHYYVMQYIDGVGLDLVIDELRRLQQAGGNRHQAESLTLTTGRNLDATEAAGDGPGVSQTTVAQIARSLTVGGGTAVGRADPGETPSDARSASAASALSPHARPESAPANASSHIQAGSPEGATQSDLGRSYFDRVARIGVQVAEAIEFGFRQGVLHRDIKPSNLLLDVRGNVWVADFGLATTTDADNLTQSGQVLGTFRYMAPERFRGDCDVRADVYSLGLTLYELLALKAAFAETDRFELIEQIQNEDPPRLRKINARIPADLETVIQKAIAHEPAHRYATPKALADDLQRFLRGEPVLARRIGLLGRASKWTRRHPWQTLSASLLFAASTALAGFFYWHNLKLRAEVARTQAKDAQSRRNYQEARATIQAMLGRLYDQRIHGVPRLIELRKDLQKDALGFYDRILSEAESNDPVVRADTARALNEAAMLQMLVRGQKDAEKMLRQSLRISESLLAEKPNEVEYLGIYTNCLIKLGPCLLALGDSEGAFSVDSRAAEVAKRLVANDPKSVELLELLAVAYQACGNDLLDRKLRAEARSYFEKAIDIRSRIDPAQLHGVTLRLAGALINEGSSFWQDQAPERAEEVFRRAEKVLLSTPKESDQTVESVDVALGQLYVNWSGMLVTRLHFQEAIERADAGLTRVEAFLRSEPNSGVARETCLKLHGNRSYALIGLDRHTESAAEWARIIELAPEPVPPVYRLQFALELLKIDEPARALAQVQHLKPGPDVSGEDCYNCACVYSLAIRAVRDNTRISAEERARLEKSHIENALQWLRSARESGLFKNAAMCDDANKDPDLAAIASLDEFRRIIAP
jgi:serine/threonine protein kinase